MQRAAVIVNPTKVKDLQVLRDRLTAIFRGYGWAPPLWSETTVEDPGEGQARAALEQGVDLVAALGGDGTMRCAASAMLGTGTPLAVLAGGTGNLFARQLGLPVNRYADALRIGLSGADGAIDAIRISLAGSAPGEFDADHIGLVMGGVGRDADIMADTTEKLKARLSWTAYLVAGMKQLRHELVPARIRIDGGPEIRRDVTSVLAGNCGMLQGGMKLMPKAVVDDGLLDAVVVRGGGAHWLPVVGKVLTRSQKDSEHFMRAQFTEMIVDVDMPQRVEVDGDVIGMAYSVRFRADRGALTVRLPR
ncbi:diacylglycerol kinase [Flexivirga endophytica]|uniref:Diacylglycerol kinase n=1 Tax=Flexivirga endophytica TaxID=1849103 RepID=A0A916WU53_9MICO|nr:diacylglycerol kinase family protein [Flexivirga endophytica]GGB30908.1 diacylglycerol kinase [Flexivirga endophytica]GHB51836.1 diacylglycerol kinase [Flexivirga endophytica]